MKVKDVMSKNVICSDVNDTILDISNIMKKNNIGFIPICDSKKIIGVITDRDIVIDMLSNKENSFSKVSNYITKKVISVDSDSNIDEALEIMSKNKIKRLLVTSNNKVTGVISISDILNYNYNDSLLLETIKEIYTINDNYHNHTEIDEFYL